MSYAWHIPKGSLGNHTNTNHTHQDTVDNIRFAKRILQLAFPSVLLTVGIPGNLLTLLVLYRQPVKESFIAIFLRCLLVFNMVALLVFTVPEIIHGATDRDPRLYSEGLCYHLELGQLTTSATCNWLSVIISSARILYMHNPFRAYKFLTRTKTYSVVIGLVVTLTLFHVLLLTKWVLIRKKKGGERQESADVSLGLESCTVDQQRTVYEAVLGISTVGLLPMVMFILMNIVLFVYYLAKHCKKKTDRPMSFIEKKHMGYLVLLGDAHFILTVGPHIAFHILQPVLVNWKIPWQRQVLPIGHTVSEYIMYSNYATNYFVYICLGKRFQLELKRMLRYLTPPCRSGSREESTLSNLSHSRSAPTMSLFHRGLWTPSVTHIFRHIRVQRVLPPDIDKTDRSRSIVSFQNPETNPKVMATKFTPRGPRGEELMSARFSESEISKQM